MKWNIEIWMVQCVRLSPPKLETKRAFNSGVRINVSFFFPKSLYTMKHDIGYSRFDIGIFCVQLKIFLEIEIYF